MEDTDIKKNIELRNGSILAHGLTPIKDYSKVDELYDQVIYYAGYVCPDIDRCMEYSKFPKFQNDWYL